MLSQKVNGDRVKQAREFSGASQADFAANLQVTQAAIALLESGRFEPSEELLNRIVFQTGFPVSFFLQEDGPEVPLGSLLFRAKMKLTAKEKAQARRYAQMLFELLAVLARRTKSIPVGIPQLNDEPLDAARLTRSSLGLAPDRPVENLTNTLERAGVLVFALPFASEDLDAFSSWVGTEAPRPTISTIEGWPGDRLRFSLAHELGHLVLHRTLKGGASGAGDEEANLFAGEFLLPEAAMCEEMVPPIKLSDLGELKLRWGVSMQALVVTAHRLGIVTDRQYKYLFTQMSMRGWRKVEPLSIPCEKPRLFGQLAERTYGIPPDLKQIAHDAHMPLQFVERVLAGYIFKDGSAARQASPGRVLELKKRFAP